MRSDEEVIERVNKLLDIDDDYTVYMYLILGLQVAELLWILGFNSNRVSHIIGSYGNACDLKLTLSEFIDFDSGVVKKVLL